MKICLLLLATALAAASNAPPYVVRGDAVETKYLAYATRLEQAHTKLRAALKKEAPDLYKQVAPVPPRPVEYGYQILPRLKNTTDEKESKRATSTTYSWPRTEQYIEWELPKIAELEEKLAIMTKVEPSERRPIFQKMVADYPELEANQRTIDSHIQYNRFWQKIISEDKPRFDKLTRLHDMALERQLLLDKKELTDSERQREQYLTQQIREETGAVRPPSFIKVEHPKPNVWVARVPLYTDITDKAFIAQVKEAIEKVWLVEDRENVYKMSVEVKRVTPAKLYGGKPPKHGEHIDVTKHIDRFPKNGGVLTTGANSTYAIPGRFVALGPQDISKNVVAHEFGHILGFVDGYFRGYRDRGNDGYDVLEVVPDPDDIMCTPGTGHVRKHHYEKLIGALVTPQGSNGVQPPIRSRE